MYRVLVFLSALCVSTAAMAAFAIFRLNGAGLTVPAVVCNLNTGVATGVGAGTCVQPANLAACNGVTDDAPAFIDFNTWAVGTWQASHTGLIGLTWTGTCVITATTTKCDEISNSRCPFVGINSLLVYGTGTAGLTGEYISLAGQGLRQDNAHSARTATANAGDTCVTLLTAANASIFVSGRYVLMTGYDLQGIWNTSYGFPPNFHYFEYIQIASISSTLNCDGVTSGASVRFTTPLVNTYKSTWPNFNSGTAFEIDSGGPATLYYLEASWNVSVEFRDMTLSRPAAQIYATGRSITYRNIVFSDSGVRCGVPSQNQTWMAINSTFPACNVELDKLVTSVTFQGGSANIINTQSSSIDTLTISNMTVAQLTGTPKRFIGSNSTFGVATPGATAYGRSDSFSCTNCVINSLGWNGSDDFTARYTMSGGVMSFPLGVSVSAVLNNGSGKPRATVSTTVGLATGIMMHTSSTCMASINGHDTPITVIDATHVDLLNETLGTTCSSPGGYISNYAPAWAVPGSNVLWKGTKEAESVFHVVDVTQDATNVYIQTNLAGGFPTLPGLNAVQDHPAPKFNCSGCTGTDPAVASLAQGPADVPLWSYQTYTYGGALGTTTQPVFRVWGNFSTASFNVTNAYAGAGTLTFTLSQFFNWSVVDSTGSLVSYGPTVNAKIACNRAVTLTTVTGSCVPAASDSGLLPPDTVTSWFPAASNSGPKYSADVSASCPGVNCPSVTVTIQTNQGVVNP